MQPHRRAILAGALCIALAGITPSAPAVAQDTPAAGGRITELPPMTAELGMQRAVATAVAWHPSVRNAAGYLLEAGDYIDVARAGYFPQVRAGLTSEHGNRNIPGYDSRQANRAVLSVSQVLYDFGKVGSSVERARAVETAAQARVLLAVDDVAREAAQAWIEVQRYEALQAVAREQKTGITAIADLVRERRRQGASARSDEVQAQAREQTARAFELEAGAQLERWRMQLRQLTGLDALPAIGGEIPQAMAQACFAGQGSTLVPPSVLVAQAEARAAQADLANARAQTRPTLSVDGSIGRGLDGDSRLGESHDSTVMLNVSAPLYQGGGNQARRRAAGHLLGATEAALENARLANSQLLQDARTQAAGNAQRAGVLDDRVDSLAQTRTLYRQQYLDLGTRSLLDLLNAEQEYQQARQERTNNVHDLARLQVDCLYGGGRLRAAFALDAGEGGGLQR